MRELRTAARYEAFIRDGAKVKYRLSGIPGTASRSLDYRRFLGGIVEPSSRDKQHAAEIFYGSNHGI